MRKHLLGLMLVAGLAGCTSESDSDPAAAAVPKTADSPASGSLPTGESLAALRGSPTSFASLPDRGELLSYGGARKSRQSGAYTYHPVALSEAHALNAIGSGELVLATPDGEPVKIKYERHEEQPDGNWTWIGRNADGSSAILTFGEKAVFGMISRGDDYYRVRTDRTGAWVVETDRSLLASNGGRRENGSDFLLPPEASALTAAAARHLSKAAPSASADVSTKAAAVIDVLIGYSSGLASVYGSQSAAATFVTSLVALTNSAYANSGVNMRLRTVHTLQVNYADTSDNQDALQQLTGYDADAQQPITPNSAFSALREAREEYGADLVAFVRRYREPEQDGCGIAWLLGMNGSGISADDDAGFGYAVVSDGEDRDESDNNTYFCSDFSLAHELGHLMGQAHNEEDALDEGAHEYSYGYREASATGFHTIMAYPSGTSQVEIPNFANPQVTRSSRPTGVAGEADNARSMNLTMPIIGQFRETVVPLPQVAPRDVNGDGTSELLWRRTNSGTQNFRYWRISATGAVTKSPYFSFDVHYILAATGDFNGDGLLDLVWANPTTGHVSMRIGNGSSFGTRVDLGNAYSGGWRIEGAGDVDGDGRAELLWRRTNTNSENFRYWKIASNGDITRGPLLSFTNTYMLAATGDFNGDGFLDLVWARPASGHTTIRLGDGAGFSTKLDLGNPYSGGWRIDGTGDVDADGRSEIFWRRTNTDSDNFRFWRIASNGNVTKSAYFSFSRHYILASTGDFNGDGNVDLVWANPSTGHVTVRIGSGTSFDSKLDLGSPYSTNSSSWRITSPGK
ncbi:reprolysin-like metallopeptidase [Luteimonas kalidii]|uniref:FG-GAP-like repeat-containing protein n=1 Tax=Luteimonas kalidii TaxID=3042025 RepID=A0ABT6JXL9_9GAMM|nr:FG-GAP-like repeat-containing protein [Luteimonas kalidii]MDH5835450.1 FG-GAP-like repeat-containing protein [Luteimonas kalidii]